MRIYNLPIGCIVRLGRYKPRRTMFQEEYRELMWKKVSDNNDFISVNAIGTLPFDAPEPRAASREHRNGGNNFYPLSAIDQYLNSRSGADWFFPSHEHDAAPESTDFPSSGFLSWFTDEEYDLLVPRTITVKVPRGSIRKYGEESIIERRVALPSVAEITPLEWSFNRHPSEGARLVWTPPRFVGVMTRTAVGPGSVCTLDWARNRTISHAACRDQIIFPVIRLANAEVEHVDNNIWALCPSNPYEHVDEMEFLSLLNAY